MPPLPPDPQIPTSSQLLGVSAGGIATLVDGTAWRIAPKDLARAKGWIPGTEITVTSTDVRRPLWPFTLTNTDVAERVAATRSRPPPKRANMGTATPLIPQQKRQPHGAGR